MSGYGFLADPLAYALVASIMMGILGVTMRVRPQQVRAEMDAISATTGVGRWAALGLLMVVWVALWPVALGVLLVRAVRRR